MPSWFPLRGVRLGQTSVQEAAPHPEHWRDRQAPRGGSCTKSPLTRLWGLNQMVSQPPPPVSILKVAARAMLRSRQKLRASTMVRLQRERLPRRSEYRTNWELKLPRKESKTRRKSIKRKQRRPQPRETRKTMQCARLFCALLVAVLRKRWYAASLKNQLDMFPLACELRRRCLD